MPTEQAPAILRQDGAPYLVWPVSRREFYLSIAMAMLPTLAWGIVISGWRVLGMLLATVLTTATVHWAIKRWTKRGKELVFAHSLVAAMVLVALCEPLWRTGLVMLAGAIVPVVLWLRGGPSRERMHVSVVLIVILQVLMVPWVMGGPVPAGMLARDRLLMGDIRSQTEATLYRWPLSMEIQGNDAIGLERPSRVAIETLDRLSDLLGQKAAWVPEGRTLRLEARKQAQATLYDALGRLPSMELLLLGAAPGRVGTMSFIGLVLGGLFLGYRYVLRIRSVTLFLTCYVAGMLLLAVWPGVIGQIGVGRAWQIWTTFPGEIVTLVNYVVFNGDAIFAAVVVLALPGTEPLTARGRKVFLVLAAVLAAALSRMNLGLPAATVAMCVLMPLTTMFDSWFGKRSWLN